MAWEACERIDTYPISGRSGIQLYESIGASGPSVSIGRAIAHTDFELLWSRDYRPQPDGSCTLVSARPNLVITYLLPRPANELPEPTRTNWATFIAGVEAHERVHGDFIKELARAIEAYSVGLNAPDDPGCTKVREKLQAHLAILAARHRERNRDFDRAEMSDGGNVHRLILDLVNGG